MTETMEQYMIKTRENYGSGVTKPTINQDTLFELKGKFLKELRDNTFSGSEHEDANEHIEKVLDIVDLFHIPKVTQDQVMLRAFSVSLTGAARSYLVLQWARCSNSTDPGLKGTKSTETSDGLAAIQAQLNNLGREIEKVNEKVHEENSNIIKEIRASTDAAIRNQGASIKTMEIQIRQMGKVLQERGFGSLPSSTEMNRRDQVQSISTNKVDFSEIRRIGHELYAISGTQHRSLFSETIPFPR
ncbi:hypothetical protein Tco_1326464 [Tanacetum coccineum]